MFSSKEYGASPSAFWGKTASAGSFGLLFEVDEGPALVPDAIVLMSVVVMPAESMLAMIVYRLVRVPESICESELRTSSVVAG